MSPLKVEVLHPTRSEWIPVQEVSYGDPDGTISDNLPNGVRNVYSFGVAEDHAYINKSIGGADAEVGRFRAVDSLGFAAVAHLQDGDSYEMKVKTDRSPENRHLRFTFTL